MKKTTQKWLALSLCALLLGALLAGCGAAKSESAKPGAAMDTAAEAPMAPAEDAAMAESPEMAPAQSDSMASAGGAFGNAADPSQKIIYNAYLQVETTTFDAAVTAVEQLTAQYGGFLESANVDGSTSYAPDGTARVVDRYARYVIRVPSANYNAALKQAGTIGNVISSNQSTENITSQFIDNEARRDSLLVQEERLLSMLEKSTDVETLVQLEARLSEVRYEIESIERQLRNWQTMVDYSTIELNLREVAVYTPTAPVQQTFGQRISDAFEGGLSSFSRSMQSFAVGIVGGLPVLVLLAVLAVAAWLIVRKNLRKRKAAQSRPEESNQPPENK